MRTLRRRTPADANPKKSAARGTPPHGRPQLSRRLQALLRKNGGGGVMVSAVGDRVTIAGIPVDRLTHLARVLARFKLHG